MDCADDTIILACFNKPFLFGVRHHSNAIYFNQQGVYENRFGLTKNKHVAKDVNIYRLSRPFPHQFEVLLHDEVDILFQIPHGLCCVCGSHCSALNTDFLQIVICEKAQLIGRYTRMSTTTLIPIALGITVCSSYSTQQPITSFQALRLVLVSPLGGRLEQENWMYSTIDRSHSIQIADHHFVWSYSNHSAIFLA